MLTSRPVPIRTDSSNAFAHNTMRRRIPAIIRETLALNPDYPPSITAALERLAADLETDQPLPPLAVPAPDYDEWMAVYSRFAGQTWLNTEWFFAETYVYRLLLQAARWWDTGRDPFWPKKQAEYASAGFQRLLDDALLIGGAPAERLDALLAAALWGNRVDLSHPAARYGGQGGSADWLLDDRAPVVAHLLNGRGMAHIVVDNAGTELMTDLILTAALLELCADRVVLHVKMHPTFVSDATADDVRWLIGHLAGLGDQPARLSADLSAALADGRLRIAPDFYWNSPHPLAGLPPRLHAAFAGAHSVIFKGDANYRRLLGDALWPPEIPFSAVVAAFPAPLLALRTLKSDPLVGLPSAIAAALDDTDPQWRVGGRYGIAQARL